MRPRHCPKCGGRIRGELEGGRCKACVLQERAHASLKAERGAGGCGHDDMAHKLTADVLGLWRKCRWCPCIRPAGMPHEEGVMAT